MIKENDMFAQGVKEGMERKCGVSEEKTIKVLALIAEDMKSDAEAFDGRPFNGRTVAEYFGNQGAAIAALANILKTLLTDKAAGETK